MGPVVPILRLAYLFLNIYDTYKVLKVPPPSARNGGQPSTRAMTQRKRDMKGVMTIWIVWCCIATYEKSVDPLIIYFPFYDEIKSILILFFIFTRTRGAEPVYLHVIRHLIKPYTHTVDTLLETIHLFGDFLVVLMAWPIQIIHAWYKGFTFTFPWSSSVADEDLQSVSSDESRPQSRLKHRPQAHNRHSSGNAQDSTDSFGAHQIWYPPPPAYEEEDHSQVRPPHLSVPPLTSGLYPASHGPNEWRKSPDFPAAYPLSPVLDPAPPPGFRIVAPVPKRPSDVIDIDNMSNSGRSDGESDDNEIQPGFHRSPLSSRESSNPNSAVRLGDRNSIHGVQSEQKMKRNNKRKRIPSAGGEMEDDGEEDGMDVDEKSGGENADEEMDEDESEDEDHAGDETFTTPRFRTMAVDGDAEMGNVSASEQENSFSLQTPLPPRRNGRRMGSNITIKRPSSTSTLNPRKNGQDVKPKVKVFPLPPHLAPQMSSTKSGSSVWSASTTLSTLGGGDSLMTGDGSEREDLETPLSPDFPSPSETPPIHVPDMDPNLAVPLNIREQRMFPRTHATKTRSKPPTQSMAISSSSSGGASRTSSRSRGSGKTPGLRPGTGRKNLGGLGSTRTSARPVAMGVENVPVTGPIIIVASDSEDVRKGGRQIKDASGADRETHSDAPAINKKRKISAALRKTSSLESKAMPPPKHRHVAPQNPIRIARSTSSGTSASSDLGAGKKVGFPRRDKSAVRTARMRNGGVGSANEGGG